MTNDNSYVLLLFCFGSLRLGWVNQSVFEWSEWTTVKVNLSRRLRKWIDTITFLSFEGNFNHGSSILVIVTELTTNLPSLNTHIWTSIYSLQLIAVTLSRKKKHRNQDDDGLMCITCLWNGYYYYYFRTTCYIPWKMTRQTRNEREREDRVKVKSLFVCNYLRWLQFSVGREKIVERSSFVDEVRRME